jgi:hypothetical protein
MEEKNSITFLSCFKEEAEKVFSDNNFDAMFSMDGSRHPDILKSYLRDDISQLKP